MKCAISGATGFVGSVICNDLMEQNHQVVALARDVSKVTNCTETQQWSLENAAKVSLAGVDVLIHSAAYLPASYADSKEAMKCLMNNSIATLELLESAVDNGVKTFVYLSSGNIYECGFDKPVPEDHKIYPTMRAPYYLASKTVGDIFADHFRKSNKIRVVTLRPSSVYGPGMKSKGLVPRLTYKMKNNQELSPEDVGNYSIDLVHVNDVAWASVQAATNPQIDGVYNIGGGQVVSTITVVRMLAELLSATRYQNMQPLGPKQISHSTLDISRAKNSFGYKPRNLFDGLRSYIESL